MAEQSITIVDHRSEDGHYTVDAVVSDDGVFRLEGHDVGRAVGEFWGEGLTEYEWVRTVAADDVPVLRALLGDRNGDVMALARAWCDANDPWLLDRHIRESSVPNTFWSRVGD